MDIANYWFQGAGGPNPGLIGNSLRFRGTQYLSKTFAADGDFTKWTYSFWAKLAGTPNYGYFLSAGSGSSDATIQGMSLTDGRLRWAGGGGSNYEWSIARLRDPSAWYHIVVVFDSNQANSQDRFKYYINGELDNSDSTTAFTSGYKYPINTAISHVIGRWNNATNYFIGYMAEAYFVDGEALNPDTFGEYNNGVWISKKYAGTYGANGFHLTFDPSQANGIGHDSSGNDNHFTNNGFEDTDTTSEYFDCMVDSPTRNFSTINSLAPTNYPTIRSQANLLYAHNTASWWTDGYSTIPMPKSGKVYYEIYPETISIGNVYYQIGLIPDIYPVNGQGAAMTSNYPNCCIIESGGGLYIGSTKVEDSAVTLKWSQTIGVAVDMDAGTVTFYSDGNLAGTITLPDDVDGWISATSMYDNTSVSGQSKYAWHNFGQQPSEYGPPAGYNWLNTTQLPEATLLIHQRMLFNQ